MGKRYEKASLATLRYVATKTTKHGFSAGEIKRAKEELKRRGKAIRPARTKKKSFFEW